LTWPEHFGNGERIDQVSGVTKFGKYLDDYIMLENIVGRGKEHQ
jgi:hypothetical protein